VALSAKQQSFVEGYLRTWNATQAAIAAGYSEKTAGSQGFDLLKKPEIQAEIKARLEASAMTTDEVLARFAQQVRFDPTPYLLFQEVFDENEDAPVKVLMGIDIDKLQADGLGYLIKTISKTRTGVRIEWHDGQRALELIGKHLGLFKEQIEHSGKIDIAKVGEMGDDELEQLAKRLGISGSG
jgi:phage terminase small subunit